MCLAVSNVRSAAQWNWDGDFIVHNPIIPASRYIPGTKKKYFVDIREFLTSEKNAVMKQAIGSIREDLPPAEKALFLSHERGSFDLRLRKVTSFITKNIKYRPGTRNMDEWMFPEETLAKESGDCEDRAFLLASMLISSGISSYMVRVALGKIYRQSTKESFDHVWVMYKNESGLWMLIEPQLYSARAQEHTTLLLKGKRRIPDETIEYIPYFVFNGDHMWGIKNNVVKTSFESYLKGRTFWNRFNPEFAAGVHNNIFDDALKKMAAEDLLYVKAVSLAMDVNPAIYDPRDHFDNGYIPESWKIINARLEEKTLDGLAHAAHTVADFYAHTSYAHFAKETSEGELTLYDSQNIDDLFERPPDYGSEDFNLKDKDRFSVNDARCQMSREKAVDFWNKRKIISGRFAQPSDPHQGFLEKTFVYIPYALRHAPDFPPRTCLPHHDEIAVDKGIKKGEKIPDGHKLYTSPAEYSDQFRLRQTAAIDHIRVIYEEWKGEKT
jgi:hypothetical protein